MFTDPNYDTSTTRLQVHEVRRGGEGGGTLPSHDVLSWAAERGWAADPGEGSECASVGWATVGPLPVGAPEAQMACEGGSASLTAALRTYIFNNMKDK